MDTDIRITGDTAFTFRPDEGGSDLSLLRESQGMPTMLTTAALALRVSDRIIKKFGGDM